MENEILSRAARGEEPRTEKVAVVDEAVGPRKIGHSVLDKLV